VHIPAAWISVELANAQLEYYALNASGHLIVEEGRAVPHHISATNSKWMELRILDLRRKSIGAAVDANGCEKAKTKSVKLGLPRLRGIGRDKLCVPGSEKLWNSVRLFGHRVSVGKFGDCHSYRRSPQRQDQKGDSIN
jgi:hypothetical protein